MNDLLALAVLFMILKKIVKHFWNMTDEHEFILDWEIIKAGKRGKQKNGKYARWQGY